MCVCVLVMVVCVLPALAGSGPAFAERQQAAVLARAGDDAALRCRVLRLAGRAVSWVRSSDLQILTHAGGVFTGDARVSCEEAPAGDGAPHDVLTSRDPGGAGGAGGAVHTLRIARVRASDAGRYECQINTEPKMSLFFNLTVVESALPVVVVRAVGAGAGGEVWGARGGAARLACEARYQPAAGAPPLAPELLAALPALRIRWTHDGDTLDPQSARGGVSLDAERWAGRAASRLTLAALGARDAGRYTCAAAGGAASVLLRLRGDHFAEGEPPGEWMQRDQAVARVSSAPRTHAAWGACGAGGVGAALLLTLLLT